MVISGATGTGKTYLACALAQQACRQGARALYRRVPRLCEELTLAHADGSYIRLLARFARVDVLVLDDWGLGALRDQDRRDLLEILEDRTGTRATIVASQLPDVTASNARITASMSARDRDGSGDSLRYPNEWARFGWELGLGIRMGGKKRRTGQALPPPGHGGCAPPRRRARWYAACSHPGDPASMIVSLHMPKTGGTSFRQVLLRHFGDDRVRYVHSFDDLTAALAEHRPGRWAAIHGHMPLGVARLLGEPATHWVTLREPVDRFISDYFHLVNQPGHPAHRRVIDERISLRDFARTPSPIHFMTQNAQVRRLLRYDVRRREPDGAHWWLTRPTVDERALEEAKETLATRVDAFGLYERFEESIREFAALVGTPLTAIPCENVTPFRLAASEVDAETIDAIRQANRLDLALYEFAAALFAARHPAPGRPAVAGRGACRPQD